jgi:3-methyladenine DNA glycosylase AlkC
MKLELSYIQNTQQWKAWPRRGRESTLTAVHSCHRTRIPIGHVLIEHRCFIKHCKRGCNKEKERPNHRKQQKGTVSKTQNQNNKTGENCDPMKLELSYIQRTQQRKAWPQRDGESTLTASHSCHRPRIPFGHVLIEHRCVLKHCKRGCNKEKKVQPTTNNKKGTVSKIQN